MANYRFKEVGKGKWEVSCLQGGRNTQEVVRKYQDVPTEAVPMAAQELAKAAHAERQRPTWVQRPLQELIVIGEEEF